MFVRSAGAYLVPQKTFTLSKVLPGGSGPHTKPVNAGVLALAPPRHPSGLFLANFMDQFDAPQFKDHATGRVYTRNSGGPYTTAPGPFGGLYAINGGQTSLFTMPGHGTVCVIARPYNTGSTDNNPAASNILRQWNGDFFSNWEFKCQLPYSYLGHLRDVSMSVGGVSASYYIWPYGYGEPQLDGTWHHWAFVWGQWLQIYEDGVQKVPANPTVTVTGQGYAPSQFPLPVSPTGIRNSPATAPAMYGYAGGGGVAGFGKLDGSGHVVGFGQADIEGWETVGPLVIPPPTGALPHVQAQGELRLPVNPGVTGPSTCVMSLPLDTDGFWIYNTPFSGASVRGHYDDPHKGFEPYYVPIIVHIEPEDYGAVQDIQVTNAGPVYATPPPVSFVGGWGTISRRPIMPVAHTVLDGVGHIADVILDSVGSGFNVAPEVVIPGGATAIAVLARTIVKVEFFSGGGKIGESNAPPFDFMWTDPESGPITARLVAMPVSYDSEPVEIAVL